jgi:N-acylneuraminate cytidylyltransferase
MDPRIVAFIFARGGSKGVPRKNILPVGGIPLVGRAIRSAKAVPRITQVILSTDDPEIADVGRTYGADTPFMRPAELSGDTASELDAWRHALGWAQMHGGVDVFVSLPAVSPLRDPADVDRCIDLLLASPDADIVVTVTKARRNPYFNMVKLDKNGFASLAAGEGNAVRRQDAPVLYDVATVAYVARPAFVMRSQRIFDGNVKVVVVSERSAIDIDTPFDLEMANLLASGERSESCP